jgi:DNA repair photolyase
MVPRSGFIKQFHEQRDGSQIVCFPFWELVCAAGCPFRCSYCFLQATPSYVFGHYPLTGALFANWREMLAELDRWLQHPAPRMLVVGELQDGLVFDAPYRKQVGVSLTEMLIPRFAAQKRHSLLFLTKAVNTRYVEQFSPAPQIVFSWSVNSASAAKRWEKGAPLPEQRFRAAERMKRIGWQVRFRLDPMVPYPDWERDYDETIDHINAIQPELVTLGALRASNTLRAHVRRNGRDDSIFDFLCEKDASGFKWRVSFERQIEMFRFAVDRLNPYIQVALCKEDVSVWRAVGLEFHGCHCLLSSCDALVNTRKDVVQETYISSSGTVPHIAATAIA